MIEDLKAKEDIIDTLSKDRNAYHLRYIKECGIYPPDLYGKIKDSKGRVRDDIFIGWDQEQVITPITITPRDIPSGNVELYVWGAHGSGKTCAIESMLNGLKISEKTCAIKSVFGGFKIDCAFPVVTLPAPSPADSLLYWQAPIRVNNGKRTKEMELSIVEIPSSIFDCFECELYGTPLTEEIKSTYDQLKSLLENGHNPKYHFFILDSMPIQNFHELERLQVAASYFYHYNSKWVFNKTTRGIYLVVTKSELLSQNRNEWLERAKNCVRSNYYHLVTSLKRVVGHDGLGLGDNSLKVIPFSIGEVFFKDLCIYDPEPAKAFVNLLLSSLKESAYNSWIRRMWLLLKNRLHGMNNPDEMTIDF